MKKKYIYIISLLWIFCLSSMAQQTITGTIKNQQNSPVLGASVAVVGDPSNATLTDENGIFSINAEDGDYLEIVYADGKGKRVWVTNEVMNITLGDSDLLVNNRVSNRTLESQTQAISSVGSEYFDKSSSYNFSNTLYGILPGLMVKQNTGWLANAELMVRGGGSLTGRNPLIVVDGIPRELNFINLDEVESVSVLKDGAATAIWGTRGANGVVMITTKRGQYEKNQININYTYGMGLPINQPEFADGYTFARMKNEALYYDGLPIMYDKTELEMFQNGTNPELFSNTNWQKEALKNHSVNNQLNISIRGGGKRLRYYSLINYKNDYGILNNDITNLSDRYNSQMKKYDLNARLNLDVDVTPYTKVALSMFGLIQEENRPNTSESEIFSALYHVPSAAFPVRTSTGVWGGDLAYKKNPIAQIADVGYFKANRRLLQSDFRLLQDLSPLAKGLRAELGVSYDNSAVFRETGAKTYRYETLFPLQNHTGEYDVRREIYGDNSALSITNGGLNSQYIRSVIDGKLVYDRAFENHALLGTLQYRQETYTPMGRNNARNRQSFLFTGGYSYADRYLVDLVVNHSGTSVLSKGDNYRTYPAVSGAWVISNESFMDTSLVDLLKVRASWGQSGNDNIGYDLDERYWVNAPGFLIGNPPRNPGNIGGMRPGNLPVTNLTIERANKYDIGVDMRLLNKLSLSADIFLDKRKDILVESENLFSSVIGTGVAQQNVGEMESRGLDLSLMWKDNVAKDFNYYVGATFSYLKTNIIENGEGYKPYDYLYRTGRPYGQTYGLEAIGFFNDSEDIMNSPEQKFSEVRPGDIKYKDQNNDGVIDDNDVVSIGYSTSVPNIYYGINLGFEYKNFGVDMIFQGVAQYSRMLNTQSVYWPLRNNNSNISLWYLEDKVRWTEETKNTANAPRLTTQSNANNFRNSTQWLEDGSYFKLRNLNVYYNLPQKWSNSMNMNNFQVYVRGNNLFSLDKVRYMNSEDFSINYPDMTEIYVGVNINF